MKNPGSHTQFPKFDIRSEVAGRARSAIRAAAVLACLLSAMGNGVFVLTSDPLNFTGEVLAATGPVLTVVPDPVNFGRVVVGHRDSQTMRLSNGSRTSLTVTKVEVTGHGYSVAGLSLPFILPAGKSITFTTYFQPGWAGHISGTMTIVCSQEPTPTTVPLVAVGVSAAVQLTASPTSLSFGNVTEGTKETKDVKVTNVGNTEVTIKTVSVSGAGFAASGGANVTLTPMQSLNVAVSFDPKVAGIVNGKLTISSNAPTVAVALTADGTGGAIQHSVSLKWSPSTSAVMGYNVYRGTASGGPYARLNGALDPGASYTDSTVMSGKIYYYVVTAVGTDKVESGFSHQVSAAIPTP